MHCVVRSTPPPFVVNVMHNIVQSVLTYTLAWTKLFIRYNTCYMWLKEWNSQLGSDVVWCMFVGKDLGPDSGLLRGLL